MLISVSFVSTVYGKPILPTSSTSPSPVPFLPGCGGIKSAGEDVTDKEGGKGGGGESSNAQIIPPPIVDNIPRPLSPTKLTPVGRYQRMNQTHKKKSVSVNITTSHSDVFSFPTCALLQPTASYVTRVMLTWRCFVDVSAMPRDPWRNAAQSPNLKVHRGQTFKNCFIRGLWCAISQQREKTAVLETWIPIRKSRLTFKLMMISVVQVQHVGRRHGGSLR